jgi:hypothetical protein
MSNICYDGGNDPVGHYDSDTHYMTRRDESNTQFAFEARVSTTSFEPNYKVHQESFQAYKFDNDNEDVEDWVFDGTHSNSLVTSAC